MDHIRYAAAACQTDLPNPIERRQMRANTDRMLSMIDSAVAGAAPFLPVRLVVFPEFAHAAPVFATVGGAAREARGADPQRAHRSHRGQGARARHLHPDRHDARGRPALARRRLQHHVPDRARGHPLQVPQGEPVDPLRGPREPARPARLRRAAVPGGRHADRPAGLRDLLRLALPRGDAPARRQRRRGADPRLGLHGSLGRDRADGLVDAREPLPRAREHGLRGRGQPGGQPAPLPAVLVAGRQHGGRLRRPHPGPGLARARRADRGGADRRRPRCATSAPRARAITCSPTCAPRPTRSTRRTAIRRERRERRSGALVRGEPAPHRRGQAPVGIS